ncbi:hypothetical protein GGR50DRAFT_263712 [Xylaria sp. CBS 124048]|nr:hypothetical protein GGR50DRAFT_263712 [Xylaria sp. CBS 124048]
MAPKESAALASSRADQASRRSMKNQRRNEKHRIRQRMATNAAGTTTAINTPAVASETTNGMNEDAVVKTESDTSDGMEQIPRVPENSGSLAAQSHGSHTHSAAGHGIRSHYKPRRYGNSRTNRDYTTRTRDQLASNGFAGLNNRIGPQQAPVGHAPPARRASRGGTRKRAAAQRAAAAAAAAQRGGAGAAAQRGGAGAAVAAAAGAAAAAQRGGAGAAAQRGGAGAAVTAAAGAAAAAQRGGGALVRGARRELPCRACLFALVNKSSNEACYDSLGAKQCSKCPDERSCVPM